MNKITLIFFIVLSSCGIEGSDDINATPDYSGIYNCDIFILSDGSQVASSSNHSVRIEKINKDLIEVFPFSDLDDLKHISFYGEMKWEDPTTAGITPFDILDKTIDPSDNNTIEIIVKPDGTVEYTASNLPILLEGFIWQTSSVNFTHSGGFKDIGGELYATFRMIEGNYNYEIYLFSN